MNKIKKSRNKGKPKMSLFKLSSKRLNKLAKQGKLKKKVGKKKLTSFLKYKTGKKSKNEPVIEDAKVEPDIPLHEADYEYYTKPGRNYQFLADIQENRVQRKGKKKNEDPDFDLVEGSFAKRPKLGAVTMSKKFLLPFKSKEKGIIQQYIDEVKPILHKEEDAINEGDKLESKEVIQTPSEMSKLSLNESKELIASISLNIIESDQQNIHQLKTLLEFLIDDNIKIQVRILAMVSLCEIFKDILPGYSIRPLSEQETKQQMKKDTKQLFNFEQSLLSSYCKFLESLEIFAKGRYLAVNKNIENKKLLRVTSLKCFAALLVTHPHFNYRTNIISVIMPFILHKDIKINEIIFDAIRQIFREDKNGVITLEIVRLIGRIIKTKNYNVNSKVLDTFLSLKIKEIQKPVEEKDENKGKDFSKRIFTSRKEKKKKK